MPFPKTEQRDYRKVGIHNYCVVVVVFTLTISQDGGTARTAIQVHAVNLTELGLEKNGGPFLTIHS